MKFKPDALGRSLFRARHNPVLQAALARRAAVSPEGRARKRAASLAWWTPERKAAWSALIREYHAAGRYPAAPPVRVWTDADRVAQGERTKALWASGRLGTPEHLAILSERQRRAWAAGRHDGQGDRKRREWADGKFAHMSAHMRALWRSGHDFGNGRRGVRRWHGGLRGELLKKFPEHADWLTTLSEEDLAGLLSTNQEKDDDGLALGDVMKNLFGEGRDHSED